jgi:hypothetical protein
MNYAFDSDIPLLMADFGVPVTIGGVTGVGIVDAQDELIQDQDQQYAGGVVIPMTKITIQTSAFPNARIDDEVILDGKNYSIRERLKRGDGATTEILLGAQIVAHTFFFALPF